jgi:NAD(P)-dependent dehydrogenase (short-subunit alcohol dehydrogenase family)
MATKGIALVTGAGSGIGKASALALGRDGFSVVVAGRRKELLDEVVAAIGNAGAASLAVPTDVADPKSVQALFDKVRSAYGRIDFVFNTAGMNAPAAYIEETTFEAWQQVIAANLTGVFLCVQAAMRQMKAQQPQGGRIVNNGSLSAHVPRPWAVPYNASKHGVSGITRSASLEGRQFNIAVGQIDIGNAATDMTAKMTTGVLQPDLTRKVEPRMDVENVAKTIVYMANLPLEANVPTVTVMANQMPYIGRG